MGDLFRFFVMRPANAVTREDAKLLSPSFVPDGASRKEAQEAARRLIEQKALPVDPDHLHFAEAARAAIASFAAGETPGVAKAVKKATGDSVGQIVRDRRFAGEEAHLADSLVAMKLLSDSFGADAPDLADLARGYDAIRLAVTCEPPSLRLLSLAEFPPGAAAGAPAEERPPPTPPPAADDRQTLVADLDASLAVLRKLPASSFAMERRAAAAQASAMRDLSRESDGAAQAAPAGNVSAGRMWMLSPTAVAALPPTVFKTLSLAGIDPLSQSLPTMLELIEAQKADHLAAFETSVSESIRVRVGTSYLNLAQNDYVGQPTTGMPTGHGNIRPVGIGDLLMVKEHVLRYEGGDLAHVENVLKSEHMSRDTRRLERSETVVFHEAETTREEQRDTQTTERFSLKRETSDTIKSDSELKAGIAVSAKYGPFIEVKANADFSTKTAKESTSKLASEFSKDVVARSVAKLTERVLDRRSTTTINEFEEKYSHGFDNTSGSDHVTGYYQWVDKVMQAQVYNYGTRLLFDVTVPEPGTHFILAQAKAGDEGRALEKPEPFELEAGALNSKNYRTWARKYDAVGLEPPPPLEKTISKEIAVSSGSGTPIIGSEKLQIEPGYRAKYAFVRERRWEFPGGVTFYIVGVEEVSSSFNPGYFDLNGEETGAIAVAYFAKNVETLIANIEIFCEVTFAWEQWQLKTHAAILQAYLVKLRNYEQALAQAQAAAGVVVAGRNPGFNAQLIARELRKQCLTMITGQHFTAFGALQLTPEDYAQPNLAAAEKQMPYVRFFEQAFEWEHLVYFFYPYFWGWKKGWKNRILLDDTDPAFGDFLRAGAARIVFPVRPGFEEAVTHYLETGQIWNGGPPPDISGSTYLPIIKEIQEARGAPGAEQPVGEPWLVHLPTTLVRLRPNDDLPEWKKAGEDWVPAN